MVFTATDGTEFETRDEWRKYEFATRYTFKGKKGETLRRDPDEIQGQPFNIEECEGCEIMLLDNSDTIQIDYCKDCKIFIGPCCESVFIRDCSGCTITIACKQLRTRDCKDMNFYLYSSVDPIIELSSQMRFAPFNGAYPGLTRHFEIAGLDPMNNHWQDIFDFNDEAKTGENWSLISTDNRDAEWRITVDGNSDPSDNPVPADAVATVWDKDDPRSAEYSGSAMKSFGFNMTQEQVEAEMPFTKEEEEQRIQMGMSIAEFRKALAEAPTESEAAAAAGGGKKAPAAASAASAVGGGGLPAAEGAVSGASIAELQKDSSAVGEMEWRVRWLEAYKLLYLFFTQPDSPDGKAQAKAVVQTATGVLAQLSQALKAGKATVWWDDSALANGEVAGVDGLYLAGLINVGDANVASLPETEEIAHAQVGDPKSFVDVHQFPAPEDYKELGTAKVAALEQLPSEVGSKISQLALMIDSFSLQHGMINDDETVGPAEG